MTDDVLKYVLSFVYMTIAGGAVYSLTKSARIFSLFPPVVDPLSEAEQTRLDKLLETCKYYHNFSYIVAGILIALSTLESFQGFAVPFGGLTFPKIQTAIGLFLLVVVLLVIGDRFFLMALPWLSIDKRRPPFAWIAMGLPFQRSPSSLTFYLPIPIAALGATIILGTEPDVSKVITFSAMLWAGYGLFFLPRTMYYWMFLISERRDHRGSSLTLSVYLLYWYRVIRQILYSLFIVLPMIYALPRWRNGQLETIIIYASIAFGVLYAIRMMCSPKGVYKRIDRLGRRAGFPIESPHYH